jgi:hypothetical protein
MFKLEYYVPTTDAAMVNEALFQAGVGRIGLYESCCFMTEGTGQFRPLEGSNPHLGQTATLERVAETKVEMVLPDELVPEVHRIMKEVHPYETPAYQLWRVEGAPPAPSR